MHETDEEAIVKCTVYIDTDDALEESGELMRAMKLGIWRKSAVAGRLAELCAGHRDGRKNDVDITLFKSVGHALEDIATAVWLWEGCQIPG